MRSVEGQQVILWSLKFADIIIMQIMLNVSNWKVSHLKLPTGMATVYRLVTKIRQKWGDRNQTFCTVPPGWSVEFATNRVWCTASIENCVMLNTLSWLQCMWEGADRQLMFRGDWLRAEYRTDRKELTDSWCLEESDWFTFCRLTNTAVRLWLVYYSQRPVLV
jgi:hypothetical protein